MNPKKFEFCKKELEFAGFVVGDGNVRPAKKTLQSIADFPVPKTITDVRGWFGLINQVSPFYATRPVLMPFRELLKPPAQGKKIYWDENLTKLFEESKLEILKNLQTGIETYDMNRITVLSTDWSKEGIGYVLQQKKCDCSSLDLSCCETGWATVLIGSRFCTSAESRYAPVEGEALGIVWALQNTRHFTLGCTNLVVMTDHKPLCKLLGNKRIEEIENPRLIRLKEATLRWNFDVVHVAGSKNAAPDALSRQSQALSVLMVAPDADEEEASRKMEAEMECFAAVGCEAPVTFNVVQEAVSDDLVSQLLKTQIESGFPEERKMLRVELRDYWRHRGDLSIVGGVPMFKGRIIIPQELRKVVLETLHAAHQGARGMQLRADKMVWWPGLAPAIKQTRDQCKVCSEIAPSQARMPPVKLASPDYPFQLVAADHFTLAGINYLVIVDRFSGWAVVERCGETVGNARGLLKTLRGYFATYGVPEELATDGGTVFMAGQVQDFLRRFQVHHRVSSAHNPHSNQRAELGVKTMKRLCRDNVGRDGTLDNDRIVRGLLAHRNTPDPDTGRSPAEVLYGRTLREFLPVAVGTLKPCDRWRLLREDREKALAKRAVKTTERLEMNTKQLAPLVMGDTVRLQNMTGPYPKRWDTTGVLVEVGDWDKYVVRVHGSGRLVTRNRQFRRKIVPFGDVFNNDQTWDEQPVLIDAHSQGQNTLIDKASPELTIRNMPSTNNGAPAREELSEARTQAQAPAPKPVINDGTGIRKSGRVVKQPQRLEIVHGSKSYDAK